MRVEVLSRPRILLQRYRFLCALQESERNRRKKRMSSDLYEFAHASCRHSIFDSLRCGRARLQRGFFHVEHSTTHSR